MGAQEIVVPAVWARRMQDPNIDGVHTHFMLVPAAELPDGIPTGANPREPNLNRRVYREVRRSLCDENDHVDADGTFHLKHRGITIVAESVTRSAKGHGNGMDLISLCFAEGDPDIDGIVDGGHSYELIRQARTRGSIPENQFVKLEVITGLTKSSLVTDIAGGRNTSLQVHKKSLMDLGQKFDRIKEALRDDGFDECIAWHENEDGDVDVVDVIAVLSCFDTWTFPDRTSHPVDAYRRKQSMLDRFASDPTRIERLLPIAADILRLHDLIAWDSEERWQSGGGASGTGGNYGHLDMVENRDNGRNRFTFPFLDDKTSTKRLRRPALLPILASFRQLVSSTGQAGDEKACWRTDFVDVEDIWREAGADLLRAFYEHYTSTGRDLHAAGRSSALWGSLYKELAVILYERQLDA